MHCMSFFCEEIKHVSKGQKINLNLKEKPLKNSLNLRNSALKCESTLVPLGYIYG